MCTFSCHIIIYLSICLRSTDHKNECVILEISVSARASA